MQLLIASPRRGGDRRGYDREGNYKFGIMLMLAAMTMFFVALLGATIVLRKSSPTWPPEGITAVPIGLPALNTVILLASSVFLFWAQRDLKKERSGYRLNLAIALALGVTFLAVQGYLYTWLFERGLTHASSVYGSIFFVLTGTHALHLLGGVVWLAIATVFAFAGWYKPEKHLGLTLCAMYWHFVDLVWLVLFGTIILF